MTGRVWAVGGLAAGVLVMPLVLIGSAGAQTVTLSQQQTPAPGGNGLLNSAKVPPAYLAYVQQAGAMCPGISAPLIAAQVQAESGWNPAAVSPAGAQGISQFMPGTWATWGKDYDANGTTSPFDPGDAIPAQGALMCALFDQMTTAKSGGLVVKGSPVENALASYNAGPGAVLNAGGFPTGIGQTDAYVPKILALAQEYTLAAVVAGAWAHPLSPAPYVATSPFGPRLDPVTGKPRVHHGFDMSVPVGTPDRAACDGVVVETNPADPWGGGMLTKIDCGGGVVVEYMHQSAFAVTPGQPVTAGMVIGSTGNTGHSTGPHLHFQVDVDGVAIDPVPFMAARGIQL